MKRLILCLLIALVLLSFCGCSDSEKSKKIHTEIQDNFKITYIYDTYGATIVSKNIYNMDTGINIEYVYFYERNGWGTQLIGVSIVTTTKDGQIISEFEDKV